jgi:hypothetical protein
MFDQMAFDALRMLIFFFWLTLAFVVIWGALWVRSTKKSKQP